MNKITKLFMLVGILLYLQACKDDEPNPCLDKVPTSAYFEAHEDFGFGLPDAWIPYDTDTLRTRHATFVAQEEEAYYTWIIGAETIEGYDKRSVTRNNFPQGSTIPITLIVQKEPNLACFPEDDGIDTLVRNIHFLKETGSWADNTLTSKALGTFRGSLTNNPEEVFEISTRTYVTEWDNHDFELLNIRNGKGYVNDFWDTSNPNIGYEQTFFNVANSRPVGENTVVSSFLITTYKTDSVRITYKFYPHGLGDVEELTFLGKKIK